MKTAAAAALILLAAVPAAEAARPSTGQTVRFSGYDWALKDSGSRKMGPGPNLFSAANATVNPADGTLHLKITKSKGGWVSSEVIAQASLGYGSYRWKLLSPIAPLDPNVVLGMFTWNDDAAYAHRELDVEVAKWGNGADPTDAQFVVQPYDAAGHLTRFDISAFPVEVGFDWQPGRVDFWHAGSLQWTYTGADVPVPGGENPRINLWLNQGRAPLNGQPAEVVLSSFTFAK